MKQPDRHAVHVTRMPTLYLNCRSSTCRMRGCWCCVAITEAGVIEGVGGIFQSKTMAQHREVRRAGGGGGQVCLNFKEVCVRKSVPSGAGAWSWLMIVKSATDLKCFDTDVDVKASPLTCTPCTPCWMMTRVPERQCVQPSTSSNTVNVVCASTCCAGLAFASSFVHCKRLLPSAHPSLGCT
jgi:hypothetical protein